MVRCKSYEQPVELCSVVLRNEFRSEEEEWVRNRYHDKFLLLVFLIATALLIAGGAAPATLSPYAEALAKIIKFDRQVLIMAKEESGASINRLIGYDEKNYQIIADGISVPVPEDRTDMILDSLRKKLIPLKYMAFVVEMNASIKTDRIGILKGTDQYEILRIMHTDGDDYDISNEDVIERLKEWEKSSPFDILGADNDWVEVEFRTLPKDLKAFVEEVYDFCPDAVDQGPGSVDDLIKEIQQTKRLFLWWD
jgi:hypothetical protein